MKIKSDFITNSSSASFVLALKKGTTAEYAKELFDSKDILSMVQDAYIEYAFAEEFDGELSDFEESVAVDMIRVHLADAIISLGRYGTELDDWIVQAGECGSESENILSLFLYTYSLKKLDNIKVSYSD